ncbi:hypothetical protein PR048_011287 [Dryococelus australis]|uniref:PiggyBac transposable element-derived protein domain-containing protein n=1 Tax=Dryococelus australis TaxID=614101 RepID=A0ABQ9HL53_9NEOP|nr:hypothetical protein PR048_011287 [Dryococelus australis]
MQGQSICHHETGVLFTLPKFSHAASWKKVTIAEMKAFIACIINTGLVKMPFIRSYLSCNRFRNFLRFLKRFSQNRFLLISKFLHLTDNTQVDESLVGTKSNSSLLEYLTNKLYNR